MTDYTVGVQQKQIIQKKIGESWILFANRKQVYIHISYEGRANEYDDDPSHIRMMSSEIQHVDCIVSKLWMKL